MKLIKDFSAYVKRTNAKFMEASKAEKRVMIAKDAIARINFGDFVVTQGVLARISGVHKHQYYDSVKDIINEGAECRVGAKGALFCSYIGRVNEYNVGEYRDVSGNDIDDSIHVKLRELFSITQLDLIETAFEGVSMLDNSRVSKGQSRRAKAFFSEFIEDSSEKERLIAICENIIENNGTFKP